jgi:putative glutamine amidotransferase
MDALLPLIGITTSLADGEQKLQRTYVEAVEAGGGIPLVLPATTSEPTLTALADRLDGLVVVGGPCVAQGMEGERPDDLDACDPLRDASDRAWLDAADARSLPLLGICYGMQLINARAGGTLYADVERQRPQALVHSNGRGGQPHPLRIAPDTHLARIMGRADDAAPHPARSLAEPAQNGSPDLVQIDLSLVESHDDNDPSALVVNTVHVQAVRTVGRGLRPSAFAPDGVVEAIESLDGRIVGTQFHPERLGAEWHPLFSDLADRARQYRRRLSTSLSLS